MSAKALHLNLLNPHERKSSSPVRARIILPIIAGIFATFMLAWAVLVGVQLLVVSGQSESVMAKVTALTPEHSVASTLKTQFRDRQAEAEQFGYYANGRVKRGELLKRLAYAIPDGITLTSLAIPPPPDQGLRPPLGSKQPPLQGPTETTERAELRLTGHASSEQDVFDMMNAIRGDDFTNLVVIAERPANSEEESPRVLAFRQGAQNVGGDRESVFFDIVYTLKPREFVK